MKPYKMQAEDKEIKVEITFKKVAHPGNAVTGNKLIAKPLLGLAHYLRGLLIVKGGATYPEACQDLAAFFEGAYQKFVIRDGV